jgi:hypothetical protein
MEATMRSSIYLIVSSFALLAAPALSALAQPATPQAAAPNAGSYGCPGMTIAGGGQGMMMGGGPWMMGHHGMMNGYAPGGAARGAGRGSDLNLSVDEVRQNITDWLARTGNPHIKVGQVAQAGPDTINAEVVTSDKGGLVQRYVVNRHTGQFRPG